MLSAVLAAAKAEYEAKLAASPWPGGSLDPWEFLQDYFNRRVDGAGLASRASAVTLRVRADSGVVFDQELCGRPERPRGPMGPPGIQAITPS
jgi:hypothetical protein